jgi:hypothetical protein
MPCACSCTKQIGDCTAIITGSAPGDFTLIQKTNVTTDISADADQVHVFAADTPAAIVLTLPPCPRIGDTVRVVNCDNATTTVVGGDNDIAGGTITVAAGSSVDFTFAACCMWVSSQQPLV